MGQVIDVYMSLAFFAASDSGSSTGQGCEPQGGDLQTSWKTTATFCSARPASPSSCLMRTGEQACPAGYTKTTWFTEIATGTARCECSGCGVGSTAGCDAYSVAQGGCGGSVQFARSGQTVAAGKLSTTSVWIPSAATCAADAQLRPSGNVQATNPYTVCCP
jgi:hypothetical protein